MTRIGSYEAKTHLPRILNRVLAGETFVVTRNGEPIAQIGPIKEPASVESAKETLAKARALNVRLGGAKAIRAMVEEGRP